MVNPLHIDLETYSSIDLRDAGVYKYAEQAEILIMAYREGDSGAMNVLNLRDEFPKSEVLRALKDNRVLKTAFNAQFERIILSHYLGMPQGTFLPPEQWRDTMILAAEAGYPRTLDKLGEALGNADYQKDKRGKSLIQYFSKPCRPTKANGERTRNYPEHAPDDFQVFSDYCGQDVAVEGYAEHKFLQLGVNDKEQRHWHVDQRINDRGIALDLEFVRAILDFSDWYTSLCIDDIKRITGIENPNSTPQFKSWLAAHGRPMDSLDKAHVADMLELIKDKPGADEVIVTVLGLRQKSSASSTKKYKKMLSAACSDGRIRGMFAFYGAVRTGRYAGRLVQIQNLPRPNLPKGFDIDAARQVIRKGKRWETLRYLKKFVDNPIEVAKALVRTALVPGKGKKFVVADFSSIESRVLAWIAGEQWKIEVFKTSGKIYEANAERMFGVPIDDIDHDSPLRQRGKVAELACGYGGGESAMARMDFKHEIDPDEYQKIVNDWRRANPGVVRLWKQMEMAAIKAVRDRTTARVNKYLAFSFSKGFLWMHLPCGRKLAYPKAHLAANRFGGMSIHYRGKNDDDQYSKSWGVVDTYGGKLVENAIQAIARDLLAEALDRLEYGDAPYNPVGHVHDEIITECPVDEGSPDGLVTIMAESPEWADENLILDAEAFESMYYKKG